MRRLAWFPLIGIVAVALVSCAERNVVKTPVPPEPKKQLR
jgi:hypothetical protein